jgi:hypothetical protein
MNISNIFAMVGALLARVGQVCSVSSLCPPKRSETKCVRCLPSGGHGVPTLRAVGLFLAFGIALLTGQAHAQRTLLSVSPAPPFAFGSKPVGSSTSQVFTVSLVGAVRSNITAISSATAVSRMTITGGTCAAGFSLGSPCTLAVTFNPIAAQTYSGFIRIDSTSNGTAGTPLIIDLSGTGVASLPTITVTPPSLNFGVIVAGTQSGVQPFTVRNTSAVNATIASFGANLSAPGSFIDAGDTCNNATLAPNQTCVVQIRFTPTIAGNYSGIVGFTLVGVPGIAAQGSVAGTATLPPLVPPILAPNTVNFPNTTVGNAATPRVLTLSNPNPQSITVAVNNPGAGFSQTTTCGATLGANASCTITVTFRPTVAGAASATVTAITSAGNVSAALAGTGATPLPPTLTPASVNFGAISVGQPSRPQVVTLTNPNTISMPLTVISSSAGFVQTNTCGASVAAGASCSISIVYTPAAIGTSTGNLQAATSFGNASAALTGAGATVALAAPEATPETLTFPPTTTGSTSAPLVITIRNPNAQSINLTGFTTDPIFSVVSTTCGATLAAAQTCTYTVVFKPVVVGTTQRTLTVNSSAGTDSISVSGTGVAPIGAVLTPLALSLTNWDFGAVTLGAQSSTRPFILQNANAIAVSPLQITTSAGFTQSNSCGLTLAAGASCQINVQYTATSLGAATGTLNVSVAGSADTAALTATATLKGLGVTAAPVVAATGSVISATPRFMQASISAATSQFITYSFTPGNPRVTIADGIFCTALTSPAPATGATATYPCAPNSEFARHPTTATTFQTVQQNGSVVRATETIRIPSAVTRTAQSLGAATFYFVRRFDPQGFAVVEIRATGAIMNAPIALNDVRLAFDTSQGPQPLVFVARGAVLPPVSATFFYTGSGVLRGRWELVLPGDVAPTERDLLPEASLPRSERGTQRRYQLLQRFEQFMPGNGRIELKLPSLNPALGTTAFDGQYQLLLRIEAEPSIHGGESGAANFAMPLLRYFVGSITAPATRVAPITAQLSFNGAQPTFSWSPVPQARYYRVEIADRNNTVIYSAIVRDTERSYSALSGFTAASGSQWRVQALDEALQPVGESPWRAINAQ